MKTGIEFLDREVKQSGNVTVVIQNAIIDFSKVPSIMAAYLTCDLVRNYIDNCPYTCDINGHPGMFFKASGVAKCSDSDVFDDKTGFRIAETRAQQKIFNLASGVYTDIVNIIEKAFYIDILDKTVNTKDSYYACVDHLDEIIETV